MEEYERTPPAKVVEFRDDDIQVVFPERWEHMNYCKWKIDRLEWYGGETIACLESNYLYLTSHGYSPSSHFHFY